MLILAACLSSEPFSSSKLSVIEPILGVVFGVGGRTAAFCASSFSGSGDGSGDGIVEGCVVGVDLSNSGV